ncbi:MAG TPA: helix-turn-helix transcriptional regulator [bacterium]|nr:helix-turn-helix transcriptional regulator [bacterium]
MTVSAPFPLADRVRRARLAAGLTQAQLAGKEVAARTISRIERGHVRPSRRVLLHIAQRLGRPLRYFVGDAVPDEHEVDYVLARAGLRQLAGDQEGAERLFARAVELASSADDPARLALARLEQLSVRIGRTRTPEAEAELARARAEAEQFGHAEAIARSHYALAAALQDDGLIERARAALEAGWKALNGRWPEVGVLFVAALARLTAAWGGDAQGLSRLLGGLGRACDPRSVVHAYETQAERTYASGEVRIALEAARHALAFRRLIAAKTHEATARYQLAQLARRSGRTEDAVAELTRACALARGVGDYLTEVQSLVSLGGLHSRAGRIGEAAQVLEEARMVFLRVADPCTRPGAPGHGTSGLDTGRSFLDYHPASNVEPPAAAGDPRDRFDTPSGETLDQMD